MDLPLLVVKLWPVVQPRSVLLLVRSAYTHVLRKVFHREAETITAT